MNRLTLACFALALTTFPLTAFAGNDDEILIGTQGARLGGAVTATVTDSTALWYNPGAIGRTRWAQFGASGTLVNARFTNFTSRGMGPVLNGDFSSTEFAVIPATLANELPLPNNWALAYGLFTSRASDTKTTDTTGQVIGSSSRRTTNFGGGVGAPLSSTLRLGLSLFGAYETFAGSDFHDGLSAFAALGMQWSPTTDWSVGLAVQSPRLWLVNVVNSGMGDPEAFSSSAPMRVRLGVAHDFGRVTVSLDGDVQPALKNSDLFIDRDLVPNGRIGVDYEFDEQTRLGLGAFTDLASASEDSAAVGVDYFGIAGGIETTTRYQLDVNEPADSIEISAFIGFRYAMGFADVSTSAGDIEVRSHEIGINLGSGLRF